MFFTDDMTDVTTQKGVVLVNQAILTPASSPGKTSRRSSALMYVSLIRRALCELSPLPYA
jgi:hypothetical protein